jgi:hypothetical protein
MTGADLYRRLAHIERVRAAQDPATMPRAAVLCASPSEDIASRL